MPKIFPLAIIALLFLTNSKVFSQQTKNDAAAKTPKIAAADGDDSEFYAPEILKADLKQASVVAHVSVTSYELVDQIGQGGCEQNKGVGYCLYRMKAQIREIFKGKVRRRNFEFYKVTEADYAHKEKMLGSHVVFLNWSDNYPDKKRSLGTLENSTRDLKHNIIRKLRTISRQRN
jgi:hypothetical protein